MIAKVRNTFLIWLGILAVILYQNFMPIVFAETASGWKIEENKISATVTGYKLRACEFVKNAPHGYLQYKGVWEKTVFYYEDNILPQASRPTGKQVFGLHVWNKRPNETPDAAMVIVSHVCNGQLFETTIGKFAIPKDLK